MLQKTLVLISTKHSFTYSFWSALVRLSSCPRCTLRGPSINIYFSSVQSLFQVSLPKAFAVPLSPCPGMWGLEQGCGQRQDPAVTPHRDLSEPMIPKPLQASWTVDPGQQQPSQRGLFRQTLGLRACWAVWPSQSCLVASLKHPGGVSGVLCLHLAVGAWGQAQGRAQEMGVPESADPPAAVPTCTGKPSQHQALRQLHPKGAPRTPDCGPGAALAAGSNQSPGQLSSDTFLRTESSMLALTFPGDLWCLC